MTSSDIHTGPPSNVSSETSRVALIPLGLSLSLFLTITFVLCAIGVLIPGLREIHLLAALYPWLDWSRPELVLVGAIGAFGFGWYVALLAGSLYNFFIRRR